jgi:hypothetical protein
VENHFVIAESERTNPNFWNCQPLRTSSIFEIVFSRKSSSTSKSSSAFRPFLGVLFVLCRELLILIVVGLSAFCSETQRQRDLAATLLSH